MQIVGGGPWSSQSAIMCSWGWPKPRAWEGLSAQGSFHPSFLVPTRSRGGVGRWLTR